MARLSKRIIDSIEPALNDQFVWDSDLPGFGLRVKPSGAKSYFLQYRSGGVSRRITLGKAAVLTPHEAKASAIKMLAEVHQGNDPAARRRAYHGAPTIADFCARYLTEYALGHKKPRSIREDMSLIENHLKPLLGRRKVVDLTLADAQSVHRDVLRGVTAREAIAAKRGRRIIKGGPTAANRTVALLSKMLNLAEEWGVRPIGSNPVCHVRKAKEKKRKRYLSVAETATLGRCLNEMEMSNRPAMSRSAINAIWLLLLTGCRKSEVLELRWQDVDLNGSRLKLKDSKTGAKEIWLAPAAVSLLTRMNENNVFDSEWVIFGADPTKHLVNLSKPWRIIRTAAGISDVRLHDLRHSYASRAINLGIPLTVIGELLGHRSSDTTKRYAHLYDDHLKNASKRIGDSLEDILMADSQKQ